jgi:hypothetical protein
MYLPSPELLTLIHTIMTGLISLLVAYNTYLTRRTELNTNSMKDALVASTAKASHAEGLAEGKEFKERLNV